MACKLRDYQSAAVSAAWQSVRRGKTPVLSLPTGSGKSWVLSELCRQAVEQWGGQAMVMQHRKELITQNREKLSILMPDIPSGIYSAGLKRKETHLPVIFAGIQSAHSKAADFGRRHVCIVDEAHLINNTQAGTYRQFLHDLKVCNEDLAIVGLTATPYRTDGGSLLEGDLFDEIAYEIDIATLIKRKFLCPLTMPKIEHEVSMQGVQVRRGEFVQHQMESKFLERDSLQLACEELVKQATGRNAIIVFTSGVEHAERVQAELEKLTNEEVGLVTGDTLPIVRARTLERFQGGLAPLRWLVNVNVLTTGFDATRIDCVALMRASVSPSLVAQMIGRGLRIDASKKDCCVLDFGGNVARHGPLDSSEYGQKRFKQEGGETKDAPQKSCPQCQAKVPASAAFCPECSFAFDMKPRDLDEKPDTQSQILSEPQWLEVQDWRAYLHQSRKGSTTMRVDYEINLTRYVSEWVCVEHEGFALEKAVTWWMKHSLVPMRGSVTDCLDLFDGGALRMPTRIEVVQEGKYWRVTDREFDCERPETWTEDLDEVPF